MKYILLWHIKTNTMAYIFTPLSHHDGVIAVSDTERDGLMVTVRTLSYLHCFGWPARVVDVASSSKLLGVE